MKKVYMAALVLMMLFSAVSGQAIVNGVVHLFAPASVSKESRVYVPLAFFNEVLGYETSYSPTKLEASISDAAYTFCSAFARLL